MDCPRVQELLNRSLDNRNPEPVAFAHRLRCRRCATTWTALRRQRQIAQTLPESALPDGLRSRVLTLIAAESLPQRAAENGRTRVMWRLVGGLTVTAGLVMTMLVIPSDRPSPRGGSVAAAQVRDALSRVNSWHLKGWRLIDGKQVVWEVWGRRNPFFYREQIGERIVVDDGTLRVQQIPPDEKLGRPGGIYLKTPSYPFAQNAPGLYETMISRWEKRGYKAARPWQETEEHAVFREVAHGMVGTGAVTESMFTVDKHTKLPIRYEMKRTLKDGSPFTSELLDAQFNIEIPRSVAVLVRPDAFNFYDATEPPGQDVPSANATKQRGMTVHVRPLAVDSSGLMMVSVEGWLGNIPLRRETMMNFHVESGRPGPDEPPGFGPHRDSTGRFYTNVNLMLLSIVPARARGIPLLFVPVTPLKPGDRSPNRLTVRLHASVWISSWPSGSTSTSTSTRLLAQDVPVTIDMPSKRTRYRIDDYLEQNWRARIRGVEEESLDAAIVRARANHYHWLFNAAIEPAVEFDAATQRVVYHPERADAAALRRAVKQKTYWLGEAVRLSKNGSREQRQAHDWLVRELSDGAAWLHRIGDRNEALRLIRQAVAECEKHSEIRGYLRERVNRLYAEFTGKAT